MAASDDHGPVATAAPDPATPVVSPSSAAQSPQAARAVALGDADARRSSSDSDLADRPRPFMLGEPEDGNGDARWRPQPQRRAPLGRGVAGIGGAKGGGGSPRSPSAPVRSAALQVQERQADSIEELLWIAHQRAIEEANIYWHCELALSREKLRALTASERYDELESRALLEPQEATRELHQAQEMRREAAAMAETAMRAERHTEQEESQVRWRAAAARDVSTFFGKVQRRLNDAHSLAQQELSRVQGALHQSHAHRATVSQARQDIAAWPAVQSEVVQLRRRLLMEQQACDEAQTEGERLRAEIVEVREAGHPMPSLQEDCDRLVRELQALSVASRTTSGCPDNTT